MVSIFSPIINIRNNKSNMSSQTNLMFLPGIGRHTLQALEFYEIKTFADFIRFNEEEIKLLLGKSGIKLWKLAKKLTKRN